MKYPRRKSKEFTSNTVYQKALRRWRAWRQQMDARIERGLVE